MAIQESVGADRRDPFPFAKVVAGVAWALSCVVLTYRYLLPLGDARGAVMGTIVWTGVPVVFLASRLVIILNAHRRQAPPVAFWPGDRSSTIANWGLVLLILYLALVSLLAATELDQLLFIGQIGRLLSDFAA